MTNEQETTKDKQPKAADIFHWANSVDAKKDNIEVDLFLFSKGYTVYATNYARELKQQLKVLFLYELLASVQTGAATGMSVREFELAEEEENVLQYTYMDKVEHAQEVIEQIAYGEEALEVFTEGEHEFKKIKGVVARCKDKDGGVFYIVKQLPQTQVLKGATAWMFANGSFQPFSAEAGLRITPDNQVLIVDDTIFAFNETKFERLFGYSAKKFAVAEKKLKAIDEHFSLSLPDGLTLDDIVKEHKNLVNKMQKIEPGFVTQEQVANQAEEIDLPLMIDDTGKNIIISDHKDAAMFINLLNDDYMVSEMTGIRYEIKSKRPLKEAS